MAIAVLVCPLCNTASAQTFSISLDELTDIYDRLYPERTRTAVWDTTGYVDLSVLQLGRLHHEVPNFLTHDFGKTTTRYDFASIEGYRVAFTHSPVYSMERGDTTYGAFTIKKPRDLSVPDLEIEFVTIDSIAAEVRRKSLRETWRSSTVAYIAAQQRITRMGKGGININIPIPMPKQLESIFGPAEKTHINITGREEITFAGETRRVNPFIGVEGRESQSLFPSLEMKQTLDVRLTGTIGDKVNIQVDHSSDALTDDANRIRLNYTGYDDDVIKLIELGNTSLSLPGSQLVSFSTQSKGLFGVKVLAQLGPTDITVIASKQEGETSSASFSPTAGAIGTTEKRVIRDIDFVKNKYFFFFNPNYGGFLPQEKNLVVYRELKGSEVNQLGANARAGRAFVDSSGAAVDIFNAIAPLASGQFPTAASEVGWFEELVFGQDYNFVLAADLLTPIGIELTQPISESEQRALAVTYFIDGPDGLPGTADDVQVGGQRYSELWGGAGTFPPDPEVPDTLVLKLIKSRTPRPEPDQFGHLWDYMMRNIYNLGLSNIDPASFRLDIEDNFDLRLDRTVPAVADSAFNEPYIRIFGLDREDESGFPNPDGLADLNPAIIDLRSGTLTFPVLEPFAPPEDSVRAWTNNEFWFGDPSLGVDEDNNPLFLEQYEESQLMYRTRPSAQNFQNLNQYNIVVEAVSTTKTFRIDALNVIENSEVVTLDGTRLTRGTDYEIDYVTGEIELKGNVLNDLTPASKIDIDYEFKPFGGGGSSSLVGFSTLSRLGENARLGSTWLYESKNVSSRKPRIGEEPTRAIVGSVNGSVQHQSERLTNIINMLPRVDTDAPSSVNMSGEIAMSIPDPNTRGEAYLDDFEGVEDSDRVSMSRRTWKQASMPIADGSPLAPDTRLGFIWYNLESNLGVTKRDLNPALDQRENSVIPTLDVEVYPDLPATDDTTSWAGVMTGFGGGGLDLTQGQFIEIWVNDFKPDRAHRGGKIRIDLGSIDENFFEPEKAEFNDEDKRRDGFAASYDDTGLDGLFNTPRNDDPESEGGVNEDDDVNGDDFNLSRDEDKRFTLGINGTEGNRYYDTEDLDRSGQMDRLNAYFSFEIDLADTAAVDIREQFAGQYDGWVNLQENDAWRLYRVNISDGEIVSQTGVPPALDQIRHVRIWFNDVNAVMRDNGTGKGRIQFADMKIVGNRWEEDGVRDLSGREKPEAVTEFAIGVISTKTDPGVYNPPIAPNIENEVADKETSLFLRYDNLEDSTEVRIFKRFQGNGLDVTQYRDVSLWVHADLMSLHNDLEYYFRLATNEDNFYEIAVPLSTSPVRYFNETGWARVLLKLDDLTNLKLVPTDSAAVGTALDLVEDRSYPIKMVGAPSLFNVRFLYAGLRSNGTDGSLHSGELWINDVFVGDVRRDIDFAQRVGVSVNFGGGVLSLSGGWTRTGPDFRGLRQRRGGGSLNEAYNINMKTAVQHFIPLAGFSIPISGSYRKSTSKPKFVPNSDTEITDDALGDSLKTVLVSEGFNTSLSKKGSKSVLLKYSIDKMTTNFSYNRTKRRAPASTDTTTSMNGTLGYQINWTGAKNVKLFGKTKFRYWLNSFDVRTTATRRTTRRWRYIGDSFRRDPFQFSASMKNSGSTNYSPFKSLTSTFSMSIDRDVRLPHKWLGIDVGTEIRRGHNFKVQYRPPIRYIKELSPDLSVTTTYNEDSSPNVRRPGDPRGTLNARASRNSSLKIRYDVGKTFRALFEKMGLDVEERDPRRPPAPTGGGQPDSLAAPADTSSGPGADPMVAVRKLAQILSDIRRVNANISHNVNSSYQRIPGRPSLSYQFGIDQNSGVVRDRREIDQPDQLRRTLSLSADTGVQLTTNIDVATRYSKSIIDTDFRTSESRATSTSFPDFQLSWKGLEKIGLFRPFFKSTQANVNWKKSGTESGNKGEEPTTITSALAISPALLFTWKNDIKSTLGVSYTKNSSETRGSKTESTNTSVNLDFKKSFHGGAGFKLPIPFFRKEVKWKSSLDTSLSIAYARAGGKRFTEGTNFSQPIPSNTSLRVSPNVAYHFSDALSGSAFVDYNRNYNEATDQTITTVRVGVTAVFTF